MSPSISTKPGECVGPEAVCTTALVNSVGLANGFGQAVSIVTIVIVKTGMSCFVRLMVRPPLVIQFRFCSPDNLPRLGCELSRVRVGKRRREHPLNPCLCPYSYPFLHYLWPWLGVFRVPSSGPRLEQCLRLDRSSVSPRSTFPDR